MTKEAKKKPAPSLHHVYETDDPTNLPHAFLGGDSEIVDQINHEARIAQGEIVEVVVEDDDDDDDNDDIEPEINRRDVIKLARRL